MPLTYPSGATIALPADASAEDWHATRATGLGGSDIAAICGLNPYTSPLAIYHAKTGTPTPRENNPVLDEAALMGHLLEPVVAARFADITGLPAIENPGTLRHPDISWALVNLDRATEEHGETGALELKTRSSYALNDWLAEVTIDVQIQVQWQLFVTGWSFAYVAALIGGRRTIVHRLDRDQELIDHLISIAGEFWGWVQDQTPPPVDGSVATGKLLDRLHPHGTDSIVVADPFEVETLLKQRATAKEQIAAGELGAQAAENRLKEIAGDATEVHIRGERAYSWANSHNSHIDWRDLAENHPEVDLDAYRVTTPYRTLRVHLETQ